MDKINWGIIGCGDVTEIKSGPAFNKVRHSSLVAVMRRDAIKVQDYARRHSVPKWYTDAGQLINDPDINAIYVATPPSSHQEYTLAAIAAGKPVYVEKPMSLNPVEARNMQRTAQEQNQKLVVAHYRRAQPFFQKIKQLLEDNVIGEPQFARIELYKKMLSTEELVVPKAAWRVDPAIAGGGLFHDLAPHQLDLAFYFFGNYASASGYAVNQGKAYAADDVVTGTIKFENDILLNGMWNFNLGTVDEKDCFEITGTKGRLRFSVFGEPTVDVTVNGNTESISFEPLQHVQQPMIEKVVSYFLNQGPNPCSADNGVHVMEVMEKFSSSLNP